MWRATNADYLLLTYVLFVVFSFVTCWGWLGCVTNS